MPLTMVALVSQLAAAQPRPVPPPAAGSLGQTLTGAAKEDYDAGRVLFEDQDYAGALMKFERAFQTSPDPRLLWNMAACEKSLRHYANALGLLDRYRIEGELRMNPGQRAELTTLIDTLRTLISRVHLVVDEPGASVYVDERLVGKTPLPSELFIDLGTRKLRVSKEGFQDQVITQEFAGGSELTLYMKLPAARRDARITIVSDAPSVIKVDGQVIGHGRWEGALLAGQHTLRITANGMLPYEKEFLVEVGQPRALYVQLQKDERGGLPTWVWVGLGVVATGGLATGAYFLLRPSNGPDYTVGTLDPGVVSLPVRVSH
jgi:tetratricopeptide (TPR) repeat protein